MQQNLNALSPKALNPTVVAGAGADLVSQKGPRQRRRVGLGSGVWGFWGARNSGLWSGGFRGFWVGVWTAHVGFGF